jgi:hypothetical protein
MINNNVVAHGADCDSVGRDSLGTHKNKESALMKSLMRCHQRHFPWSAVMMARVAWVRVDPALPMALL